MFGWWGVDLSALYVRTSEGQRRVREVGGESALRGAVTGGEVAKGGKPRYGRVAFPGLDAVVLLLV